MQSKPGSHVQTIEFVVFRFRKIGVTLDNDYVTSCASAASAAGMFQMDVVVQRHVQNGFSFPMVAV